MANPNPPVAGGQPAPETSPETFINGQTDKAPGRSKRIILNLIGVGLLTMANPNPPSGEASAADPEILTNSKHGDRVSVPAGSLAMRAAYPNGNILTFEQPLDALEEKVRSDPEAILSREEVRFLYDFDYNVQPHPLEDEKDPKRIAELRDQRGKIDYAEISVLISEELVEKFLPHSYNGYQAMIQNINRMRGLPDKFRWFGGKKRAGQEIVPVEWDTIEQSLGVKKQEWRKSGLFDYLAERLVVDSMRYTLVITPNVPMGVDEVLGLGVAFGKNGEGAQQTSVSSELYHSYSSQQLSGYVPDAGPVRFSLLPRQSDPLFNDLIGRERREALEQLRADRPDFNFHVPSVLEAIARWYELKELGMSGERRTLFSWRIQHFDLPARRWFDEHTAVPASFMIHDLGWPRLRQWDPEEKGPTAIAVG